MNANVNSAALTFAGCLAFLAPTSICAYRIIYFSDPALAAALLRPIVVGVSVLLCLILSHGLSVTRAEKALFAALAILCATLLLPTIASASSSRAFTEWTKLLIMCTIPLCLARALRREQIAKVFGYSLLAASLIFGALIVGTYLKYMGLVLPSYDASRSYKQIAMDAGLPLNSVAFECLFSYMCAMCLIRSSKLLWIVGAVLLLISSFLTGSRAPLVVVVLSVLVLLAILQCSSRYPGRRFAGCFLAIAIAIVLVVLAIVPSRRELSMYTEGRSELWSLAIHKFEQRPLLGYGYLSASDDLGYITGGYHNEFVTALAEQGIVGSVAVFSLFAFVFYCCWKLAVRRTAGDTNGRWILFAYLVLFFRSFIELPGLFGTAQAPPDFLAYIFLGIVIAQLSRTEDVQQRSLRDWNRRAARVNVYRGHSPSYITTQTSNPW